MNRWLRNTFQTAAFLVAATVVAVAQTPPVAPPAPVEILGFKIGSDYYPMLDNKPSPMAADNPDFPRLPSEVIARQNRRGERGEETKARGKIRSTVKVLSDAQWVKLTLKNTGLQPIKALAWDFAFPRYEDGKLILRADVLSQIEIKPGGKKTLKQMLPSGVTRCQAMVVSADENANDKAKTFEAVCGRGFNDPTQLKQMQETVLLKRIEFADGSVWQR